MIKGIGVDAVDLVRIEKTMNDRFIKKILTVNEQERFYSFQSDKRKIEYLAGRFAAKEAFSKAYGTGIGEIGFQDIETFYDESGRPFIRFFGQIIHLSITHTDSLAIAYVVID